MTDSGSAIELSANRSRSIATWKAMNFLASLFELGLRVGSVSEITHFWITVLGLHIRIEILGIRSAERAQVLQDEKFTLLRPGYR